jgi:hypothetical protein
VRTLWLTVAAQPVLGRILRINQDIREEAFDGLAPSARDALIDALALVKGNLATEDEAVATATDEPTREDAVAGGGTTPAQRGSRAVGTSRP